MPKVKVCRACKWDAAAQDYFVSSRMFTAAALKMLTTLEAIPETETEIDASQLVPGEG